MGGLFRDTFQGLGLSFSEPKPCRIVNRTGGARLRGEVVMIDVRMTVATTWRPGRPDSVLATGVLPTVAEDGWAFLLLLDQAIENGAEGRAWVWHPSGDVLYEAGQDPATPGAPCSYNNLQPRLDGTAINAASKVYAISIDSTANRAAGSLMNANFNGLFGWGKG